MKGFDIGTKGVLESFKGSTHTHKMRFRDVSVEPFGGQFVVLIGHSCSSSPVMVSQFSRL